MKLLWWLLLIPSLGCGAVDERGGPGDEPSEDEAAPRLTVVAVSYPLQYFAARIGGGSIAAIFPVPAGVAPSDWRPSPEAISRIQTADLILLNGAGFAKWTERVTLPSSRIVDTSSSLSDRFITVDNAVVHSHGPEGEHSHGETASWTWLDPTLAIEQAAAIRDAFTTASPDAREELETGFDALRDDLLELDERLAAVFRQAGGEGFAIAGPVLAYLSRRYELDAVALPSSEAGGFGEDDWHDVEHVLEDHSVKWLLSIEPLSPAAKTRLDRLGVRAIVIDPADTAPSDGDYLSVMESNVVAIERALTP